MANPQLICTRRFQARGTRRTEKETALFREEDEPVRGCHQQCPDAAQREHPLPGRAAGEAGCRRRRTVRTVSDTGRR